MTRRASIQEGKVCGLDSSILPFLASQLTPARELRDARCWSSPAGRRCEGTRGAEHFFTCQRWSGLDVHGGGEDALTHSRMDSPGLNGKGL